MQTATRKRHVQHEQHSDPKNKSYTVDLCDSGTIYEFLDVVEAGDDPVNCLDINQTAGNSPLIVKYVLYVSRW